MVAAASFGGFGDFDVGFFCLAVGDCRVREGVEVADCALGYPGWDC